ncbi:hypothetical protein I6N95_14125 [Vagococcus sp. BWB3-3]|uniref:Uncharacterized protein n=1 Tax=Vagococcus allomyrinae TaxID=2794353 RepID=A0A940PDU8_9ENTE|nr:hypothetical protein [Vagococcus allomyrinae]MBP1042153.1 hypothetical protein [Vagococcus allomyrinae]
MGMVLIVIDCFSSILFSILVSFAMSQGHFFQIQLTAVSLVGIIFVCLAEIVN